MNWRWRKKAYETIVSGFGHNHNAQNMAEKGAYLSMTITPITTVMSARIG